MGAPRHLLREPKRWAKLHVSVFKRCGHMLLFTWFEPHCPIGHRHRQDVPHPALQRGLLGPQGAPVAAQRQLNVLQRRVEQQSPAWHTPHAARGGLRAAVLPCLAADPEGLECLPKGLGGLTVDVISRRRRTFTNSVVVVVVVVVAVAVVVVVVVVVAVVVVVVVAVVVVVVVVVGTCGATL